MIMYTPPKWMDSLLLVPGLLWEAAVRSRNRSYDSGRLPVRSLPRPVISIGNITLGGSGKTPLVIHVARLLEQMGVTPVLLSRGYGRSSNRRCEVVTPEAPVRAPGQELGDEPALVRRSVPGVWLGIAADRFEAGTRIAARLPDAAFILDDGFQHRKLRRNLDLLMVDASQPLETNRIFPRGSLREPIAGLRRSHAVIINGADGDASRLEKVVTRIHPAGKVYFCRQRIERILPYQDWAASRPAAGYADIPVYLIAAIGNPARFRRDVAALGLEIRGSYFYRDHFTPDLNDWRVRWKEARAAGARCMLTTEKDAVKILEDPGVPLLVAVQSTGISDSGSFLEMIRRTVTEWNCDGDRT
jgi:tetraacyldisaccharide 4'-kinase